MDSQDWECIEGINTPIRLNNKNDLECMSANARDCMWTTPQNCNNLINNPPENINPLVCGEMHRQKWGSTGYNDPNHWCPRGKEVLMRNRRVSGVEEVSQEFNEQRNMINIQDKNIKVRSEKLENLIKQVKGQNSEIMNKKNLLEMSTRMVQESFDKNVYKKKLTYFLISLLFLFVLIISGLYFVSLGSPQIK